MCMAYLSHGNRDEENSPIFQGRIQDLKKEGRKWLGGELLSIFRPI